MEIKDKFIKDLVEKLNDVNERQLIYNNKSPIDVCYVVSVIDQQIKNYKEFLDDIAKFTYCINGYDEDTSGGYTNGKIRILIEKPEEEKESDYMVDAYYDYCYFIEFSNDERMWGYCQCTPEDGGYNSKYNCCGNGCDWNAPSFRLTKEIYLGYSSWNGQESDYWQYKEQFESDEQNKNNEVEKFKKEQRKQNLKNRIEELQKEIRILEDDGEDDPYEPL